ncbi:DoxX family protein [Flammeovirgaceae bacterium SG7u.111]|nr:DoxX family protein [Flammeovirgaceae bacterium SG7u.132]WPO37786.1 DoxX family protein [Flammeovirgaceae bacterium SG7u.111]
MKNINKVIIIFLGVLFIFSGLIKLNDPMGTAIKLEEYFDIFAEDFASFFHFFSSYALPLAVFVTSLEVILGLALLVGFKLRYIILAMLGLIIFFTFLTFYSAYFDKVTDCGCFGDAIPLDPWQSFYKDVVLTVLILVLVSQLKSFSNSAKIISKITMGSSVVFCMVLAWYVLNYLPVIDFRDYKVGNSIPQLMQPQAPCQYEYIMEKDGETFVFDTYPTDKSYEFKDMNIVNEKECMAKIMDYNLIDTDGQDFTQESLLGKKLFVVVHKVKDTDLHVYEELSALVGAAENAGITPMVLTSEGGNFEEFRHQVQLAAPYYFTDETVLKAMVRYNPGILLLEDGVVQGKWSGKAIPSPDELQSLLSQ